jgi:hypothetical protein
MHIHIGLVLTRPEKKNARMFFLLYKEQYNKKKVNYLKLSLIWQDTQILKKCNPVLRSIVGHLSIKDLFSVFPCILFSQSIFLPSQSHVSPVARLACPPVAQPACPAAGRSHTLVVCPPRFATRGRLHLVSLDLAGIPTTPTSRRKMLIDETIRCYSMAHQFIVRYIIYLCGASDNMRHRNNILLWRTSFICATEIRWASHLTLVSLFLWRIEPRVPHN